MTAPWQRWDLHPSVIIGLALLGGLYVYWGGLAGGAPRRRIASFGGALAVLGLALNGPLHNLSDSYLFSAHMVQHLVLTLVFPPLLLYGTPAWRVEAPQKHIEPAQQDEPDDHARMQVPVLPGPWVWRRQRHPAPAAPPPLSVSAPKKRNSSATITPRASSSGAPNRNAKNLLSAFKCM